MAYQPGYPVIFTATGDRTKEAIYKHIQEFLKVYETLNELNLSASGDMDGINERFDEMQSGIDERFDEMQSGIDDAIATIKAGDVVVG